jgi:hypothetical protein
VALTLAQQQDAARQLGNVLFSGQPFNVLLQAAGTASVNYADLLAAVQQIDSDWDTSLSAAVTALGGSTTIINALNASIPSPASALTAAQKTIIGCAVLPKRAGLL